MPLSVSEQALLRKRYDSLKELVVDKEGWDAQKEAIIQSCIENEIPLYNIVSLQQLKASQFLSELLSHVSVRSTSLSTQDQENWRLGLLKWQEKFNQAQVEADQALRDTHDRAYLSVGDQYKKTGRVSPKTLLTMKDMEDLLKTGGPDDRLVSKPFSLAHMSSEQGQQVVALIKQGKEQGKDVLLPVNHDGHWFYLLLKEDGVCSICDSQPIKDDKHSPRQLGMIERSTALLDKLLGKDSYGALHFRTTGEQTNNYDCGTRVVNACRGTEQTHTAMLTELLHTQCPEMAVAPRVPEQMSKESSALSKKVDDIVKTTATSQATTHEKFTIYKQTIKEVVESIAKKDGLFGKIKQPLAIKDIDAHNLAHGEGHQHTKEDDEEFAARLQEAEYRKLGGPH